MNRTESINTLEDVDGKLFRDWQDYNKRSKKKGVWPFGSKVPDTEETKVPISVASEDGAKDAREDEERETWGGKFDFILSMIGNAVGLGNVWRFPYMAYKNGGAAFLIPYFISMFVVGIGAILIESAMGQYSAMGTAHAFNNCVPLFKGIGLAQLLNCIFIVYYYNVIISWAYYFLAASFASTLPWSACPDDDKFCFATTDFLDCKADGGVYLNSTCLKSGMAAWQEVLNDPRAWYAPNDTCVFTNGTFCDPSEEAHLSILQPFHLPGAMRNASSQVYFKDAVLQLSSGLGVMGAPSWWLTLCLAVTWAFNFLSLFNGIKTSGKVVYFTATFPYLVILILLVRAATLDGAYEGIDFYINPEWSKLGELSVWTAAAGQILFSLSAGNATMATLSSYNKFHKNIIFDVFLVSIANCLTSFIAGFAIFGTLGYLAKILDSDVEEVVESGIELAFVTYPDLLSTLPLPQLWSILFFLMLITLGIDSSMCMIEAISTFVIDSAPRLRSRKTLVTLAICVTLFVLSLPFACPGGFWLLNLLDVYFAGPNLIWVAFLEAVMIAFAYGVATFVEDLVEMTRLAGLRRAAPLFYVFYYVLTPGALGGLLIMTLLKFKWLTTKSGAAHFEAWADYIGTALSSPIYLIVPVVAGLVLIQRRQDPASVLRHTSQWRKHALKQNKIDKHRGEERMSHYKMEEGALVRCKVAF